MTMKSVYWHIDMLGGLCARCGSVTITRFESRKAASLLAYLAYLGGKERSRELLAELLWPDEEPDATRQRFRQTLASLRRTLEQSCDGPPDVLVADRNGVHLAADLIRTDVAEFETLLEAAQAAPSP